MLGWELPPENTGGLGTACLGLAEGLSRHGVDVLLVVPRAPRGTVIDPRAPRGTVIDPRAPRGTVIGPAAPRGATARGEARPRVVGCDALLAEAEREERGGRAERPAAAGEAPVLFAASPRGEAYGAGDRLPPNRLEVLPVPSPLSPYLTEQGYAERLSALAEEAERGGGSGGFRGGYGATLGAEVARYADVVGELARRERFDVVHAHDWMTFPAGLRARAFAGRPLVCHVHACEFDRNGDAADPRIVQIERSGLLRADRVAAVSRYTAGVLRERYGVDPARVRVVHNGVAAPEPAAGSGADGGPGDGPPAPPLVLFVGRMTAQKGPGRFLAAAARVARVAPEVRFAMCGDGELLAETKERARRLGLADRVRFPGFLRGPELDRAYRSAAVLVVPSVSEPFGLVGLEALARGVPVVAPRRSGLAEVSAGSLRVDSADVDDLADKILSVLRRPALRRQLVEDGRRDLRRLGWERSAAGLLDVYRELVA